MANEYRYNVGVLTTFADPLHINHLNNIYDAANECKELYIVLFYRKNKDSVNYKLRYQWIYDLTSQFSNITILTEEYCENSEEIIRSKISKNIDIYYYEKEAIINNCKKIHIKNTLPINSTEISKHPLKYWEYLPKIVRKHYVKKILIIGNESTGKSVISKSLANLYNTECVEEYSRHICSKCGGEDYMTTENFEEIIYQHKINIINASENANRIIFIDTDAFMSYYYRNQCNLDFENNKSILDDEKMIQRISNNYDLVLFMESDVPYIQDDLRIVERNNDELRLEITKKIKDIYLRNGIEYEIISGNYKQRLRKAKKIINERFDL